MTPRTESGDAPARREAGTGEGRGRTGTGETSACCVVAEDGTSDAVDVDAEVPRDGVRRDGVVGRLDVDAGIGGNGERVRRPMEPPSMGDCGCADGELLRCTSIATDGIGDGMGALRDARAGESVGGVGGATVGVLRPERVDKSATGPGGGVDADSGACSSAAAAALRVARGGNLGALEAMSDVVGAGARTGTGGGMFSSGFGTRSASRINRKSRPNS